METNIQKVADEILIGLRPDMIGSFVPAHAAECKRAFIAGEVRNPHNVYEKLNRDYTQDLHDILDAAHNSLDGQGEFSRHIDLYEETVENFVSMTELMYFMNKYNHATDTSEKEQYKQEVMKINIELYGAPRERDYHHVLATYLSKIEKNNLRGHALVVYSELVGSLPIVDTLEDPGGYEPEPQTVQWMQKVVETMYGGMLAHVKDDSTYNPKELRELFDEILKVEFGEAADGWVVVIEPAKSIVVKVHEKRIVIPEDRDTVTSEQAKDLVVHELGVHVLRAIYGFDSDIAFLVGGLSGSSESEEGLAMVTQQARTGKYVESGHGLYLAASFAYLEHKDFRETYELMWRIQALSKCKDDELTDEKITEAKDTAYNLCMRIFRGTDDIPWFKDLQYYNGSIEVWKHLDHICGDDVAYQLMLIGKTNVTSKRHQMAVLESRSS
ncbi:DUF1704 domain-containing protein [Candidatus Saccharibacteria bacterium]|nr:DUF1704 domain-containing protein [Candidatus Saccharibacteria bacterium]